MTTKKSLLEYFALVEKLQSQREIDRHAALTELVNSACEKLEERVTESGVRMTPDEIAELCKSEEPKELYDLRTSDGCFQYGTFLRSIGRKNHPTWHRAMMDAVIIAGFPGDPVKILVWDNRRALVPESYADFCDEHERAALRVFGYGGRA